MSTYGRFGSARFGGESAPVGDGWFSMLDTDLINMNAAVSRQARLEQAGTGLTSFSAEIYPDRFYAASPNDTEARLRAAFWLFVGARILRQQGNLAGASTLRTKAAALWKNATRGILVPGGESSDNLRRIPDEAAALARAQGLAELAAVLSGQADTKAVQTAVKLAEQDSLGTKVLNVLSGKRADGSRPWGLYLLGGTVLFGALLFLGRPYLQAAQAAARRVGGNNA